MKMNTAKAKGRETEAKAVDWLRTVGAPYAERRRLTGFEDQGDITGLPGVCIEVKSGAKVDIPRWLRELAVEMVNAHADTGAVMVRPKGKPDPREWWIVMAPNHWAKLMQDAGWLEGGADESAKIQRLETFNLEKAAVINNQDRQIRRLEQQVILLRHQLEGNHD